MPLIRLERQLSNSGNVKCNGYLVNGVLTRPSFTMDAIDPENWFEYGNSDLVFSPEPTTLWPENDAIRDASTFYNGVDNKFLENPIKGQWHDFRLQVDITKQAGQLSACTFRLYNPLSGFTLDNPVVLPKESASIQTIVVFNTIADNASISNGYKIGVHDVDDNGIGFELTSMTRHSSQTATGFPMTSLPKITVDAEWVEISTGWQIGTPYVLQVNENSSTVEVMESGSLPSLTDSAFLLETGNRLDVFYTGTPVYARNKVAASSSDTCILDVFEAH